MGSGNNLSELNHTMIIAPASPWRPSDAAASKQRFAPYAPPGRVFAEPAASPLGGLGALLAPRGRRLAGMPYGIRCAARPESASQPIYGAVRLLLPVLQRHRQAQVRLEVMHLTNGLNAYLHAESQLQGDSGLRPTYNAYTAGLGAVTFLQAVAARLDAYKNIGNLRPFRRLLAERAAALESLAARARLELSMRAPAAGESKAHG